jgi:hypothetical protein
MSTIRLTYIRWPYSGVGVLVLIVISISTKVVPLFLNAKPQGPTFWESVLVGLLTSSTCFGPLFWGYEWLVRKHIWRLLHPELDLNGRWSGTTTYEVLQRGDPQKSPTLPQSRSHETDILQDALSIVVRPARGDGFVSWQAEAADLSADGTLTMAYSVRRHVEDGFPVETLGYEVVRPVVRNSKQRPEELAGTFFHAAQSDIPLYSGRSDYKRM